MVVISVGKGGKVQVVVNSLDSHGDRVAQASTGRVQVVANSLDSCTG